MLTIITSTAHEIVEKPERKKDDINYSLSKMNPYQKSCLYHYDRASKNLQEKLKKLEKYQSKEEDILRVTDKQKRQEHLNAMETKRLRTYSYTVKNPNFNSYSNSEEEFYFWDRKIKVINILHFVVKIPAVSKYLLKEHRFLKYTKNHYEWLENVPLICNQVEVMIKILVDGKISPMERNTILGCLDMFAQEMHTIQQILSEIVWMCEMSNRKDDRKEFLNYLKEKDEQLLAFLINQRNLILHFHKVFV
jgi:hypothetical protein